MKILRDQMIEISEQIESMRREEFDIFLKDVSYKI